MSIEHRASIKAYFVIELTEQQAGALDALVGYGTDTFLEVFYKHLGEAYLKPYEAGLRSLFEEIREESGIGAFMQKARDAREVFSGYKIATYIPPVNKS